MPRRRGSLFGWVSDVLDATHDYADDWIDRADDFEYDAREAVDDVTEDRYRYYDEGPRGPRRYYYDRQDERNERDEKHETDEPPAGERGRGRRSSPAEAENVDHLKAKIDTLAKQVEALLQRETTDNAVKHTPPHKKSKTDSAPKRK